MGKIRLAIAGLGNCASSLVQGIEYYKNVDEKEAVPGLMHNVLGGYRIKDIRIVAAFDVDERKVGKDVSEAIFARPNCTKTFCRNVPETGVVVQKGPVLDGVAAHMREYPDDISFRVSGKKGEDVTEVLNESGAEVLVSYMPVGSYRATKHYAEAALKAGAAFVNAIPEFIASDLEWERRFREAGVPVIGDDIKSQVGATIVHRVLTELLVERGVKIERTYQLNFGGNTDFLNMLERARLKTKKVSKTEAVRSMMDEGLDEENIHIGPSDFVPWLKDNKVCYIRIEGRKFGDVPVEIELKLSVEDSPNSAGVMIDAIRCAKIALDRGIGGALISASAYFMKHPPEQIPDFRAREMLEEFIRGERDR
ncbi:MAG: inositol-3-phosphate synthase [Candidatus Aenigmatarchaeota archaeon]|nr:MAG: inositol-3-phosphate synthase [Candidatus Aenigmarchaeota archaeon]